MRVAGNFSVKSLNFYFHSGGAAVAETGVAEIDPAGLKRKIGAEAGVGSGEDDTRTVDY